MNLSRWKVTSTSLALVLSAVVALNLAVAQQKPEGKGKAVAGAAAKQKGRLPPYYKDIVDEKQKAAIYSIQADYNGRIDALKEQLEKLTADRDAAIENVLSVAQKDKLKKAKEAAASKRKKPEDKPEDKPDTEPAAQ